jgi:hypothetical protein
MHGGVPRLFPVPSWLVHCGAHGQLYILELRYEVRLLRMLSALVVYFF